MSTDTQRIALVDAAHDLQAAGVPPTSGDRAQVRMADARHEDNRVWSIGGPIILFLAVCVGTVIAFHGV